MFFFFCISQYRVTDFYYPVLLQCVCLYFHVGACEEPKLPLDGLEHRKPKQLKLPSPACVDLPLWKDGQRENPVEADSWEDGTCTSTPAGSPQVTPTNSLRRPLQRKKTESALFGCTVLLASVALGLDIRELHRAPAAEDPLPKEEKKKREGLFQRATKARRSASPPPRLPAAGWEAGGVPSFSPPTATNLFPVSSLSTKCLLQPEGEDLFVDRSPTCHPEMPTPGIPRSNHKVAPVPGLVTDQSVLKSLPPPVLGQTRGNVPYFPSKDRGSCHRRTRSEGNPLHPPCKLY